MLLSEKNHVVNIGRNNKVTMEPPTLCGLPHIETDGVYKHTLPDHAH